MRWEEHAAYMVTMRTLVENMKEPGRTGSRWEKRPILKWNLNK
jgi:hypothetical protein